MGDGSTGTGGWSLPSVLARRWPTIALITALVLVAVFVMTSLEARVYAASSTVVLDTSPGQSPTDTPSMPTEQQVAESPAVAAMVIRRLHLHTSPQALLRNVSVSVPLDSQVLKFTYSSPSPSVAQERAQAFATGYLALRRAQLNAAVNASTQMVQERIDYLSQRLSAVQKRLNRSASPATISSLQTQATSLTTQIVSLGQKLSDLNASATTYATTALIGPASRPTSPARPRTMLNLTLGVVGGILLGLAIAAAREYADDRVRGQRDLELRLQAPVLGPVPVPRKRRRRYGGAGLVTLEAPTSGWAESYRRLAVEFQLGARAANAKSAVVTSGERIDGKTFVTANLAVVLAGAGKRVVVVSCDVARPGLEDLFNLPPHVGLTEVLQGAVPLRDALQETRVHNLHLISHGAPHDAVAPFSITGTDDVIAALRRQGVDMILVDASPMLDVNAAATVALAAACDGVVLISQTSTTTAASVSTVREQLDRLQSTILAGVLVETPLRPLRRSSPAAVPAVRVPPEPVEDRSTVLG